MDKASTGDVDRSPVTGEPMRNIASVRIDHDDHIEGMWHLRIRYKPAGPRIQSDGNMTIEVSYSFVAFDGLMRYLRATLDALEEEST